MTKLKLSSLKLMMKKMELDMTTKVKMISLMMRITTWTLKIKIRLQPTKPCKLQTKMKIVTRIKLKRNGGR